MTTYRQLYTGGWGKVNGFTQRVKTAWPCLGWAIKSRRLELVGHFHCYDHKGPRKQCSHLVGPPKFQFSRLIVFSGAV